MTRYFQYRIPAGRLLGLWLLLMALPGCKKYLEVPPPINTISGADAFQNDNTAAQAVSYVYSGLLNLNVFDGSGVGFYMGMYGDELKNQSILPVYLSLYGDVVGSSDNVTTFWTT
ncbi:MAG TPA: hypothetical protein VK518_14750, partial [Puia sp.]|nr:hypothetical protein [Puia sp.]